MVSRNVAIGRLAKVAVRLASVETDRDRAVAVAIDAGCTWAEIGDALGVSAQAAHKRFRDVRVNADGIVWREPRLPYG